jgi:hypothetical protein
MAGLDDSHLASGPELFLRFAGHDSTPRSCMLLGIAHGKMHIRSEQWIEPATTVSALFAHLTVSGEVLYCIRKETWYRACIDLMSGDDRRREPRLAVHQPATVITFSGSHKAPSIPGILLDLAVSGMRLQVSNHVEPGTMIYVETGTVIVAGEVRNCQTGSDGHFEAGIEITDVVSEIDSHHKASSILKNIRHKLAQAILGEPISASRKPT